MFFPVLIFPYYIKNKYFKLYYFSPSKVKLSPSVLNSIVESIAVGKIFAPAARRLSKVIWAGWEYLFLAPTDIKAYSGFTSSRNKGLEEVFEPWCPTFKTSLSKVSPP